MTDLLKQYRINTQWRNHVLNHMKITSIAKKERKPLPTVLEYCGGNERWAEVLNHWIDYMKEEELFSFYTSFVSESFEESKRSIELLFKHIDSDPKLRMPLLRDAIVCYSRPFRKSKGLLGRNYKIDEKEFGIPSPAEIHEKMLSYRDQLHAHCDLSAKQPRVSTIGISFTSISWEDYNKILPDIANVIKDSISLLNSYIQEKNMLKVEEYFASFVSIDDLSTQEPLLLNQIHGFETK
ncbi:MAG: hypothetical protein ACD_39C01668G0003 [uncultured bacterium]|nr:MAG: hypothetical protein ACD_39C01668G0003 [uncultured bacterium]